ncbi:MAG: hypothetical protein RSB64_20030, partial [Pseudomonas sp.]
HQADGRVSWERTHKSLLAGVVWLSAILTVTDAECKPPSTCNLQCLNRRFMQFATGSMLALLASA